MHQHTCESLPAVEETFLEAIGSAFLAYGKAGQASDDKGMLSASLLLLSAHILLERNPDSTMLIDAATVLVKEALSRVEGRSVAEIERAALMAYTSRLGVVN
jgi:hypothetical protein